MSGAAGDRPAAKELPELAVEDCDVSKFAGPWDVDIAAHGVAGPCSLACGRLAGREAAAVLAWRP